MDWSEIDWNALRELRQSFLESTAGITDYWQSESLLASYDATFAQRIGWKWDYVLEELKLRGWLPPPGAWLDWGCGSGIATRACLDQFGESGVTGIHFWDRSAAASAFAAQQARRKYPNLPVHTGLIEAPTVLLISHVITELSPEQIQALADLATTAQCVIWVEPGTYDSSLTLIAIRERLRAKMQLIAPCTHSERCGILLPQNERHWCHHFAVPPARVFTDANWSRFANEMGIDLRDLPLSFLVLDQRPAAPLPAGATRILGHPRVYKAHALMLSCDASGVEERELTKRAQPEIYKKLKKHSVGPLQIMTQKDGKISSMREYLAEPRCN